MTFLLPPGIKGLKVTKNNVFTLSLEDTFFEKPQGERGQFDPPSPSAILGLTLKTRHAMRLYIGITIC